MFVRRALALLLLAACDRVLGLAPLREDANVTADVPPDGPVTCLTVPVVADGFDSPPACGEWGNVALTGSMVVVGNSAMTVTPIPGAIGFGGCIAKVAVPLTETGVFVQVPVVGQGDAEYTELIARDGTYDATINVATGGSIAFSTLLENGFIQPYLPSQMQWWRIRTTREHDRIVGEYSANGADWMPLGEFVVTPPPEVTVTIGHGTSSAETVVYSSVFATLNICP
jgi:hypothetical protein